MAKRYLGYGYTNAQGVAKLEYDSEGNALTHSYTGVGAGKIDIVAESGTLQSETYSILDCISFDDGIQSSYNNIWGTTPSDTSLYRGEYFSTWAKTVTGNKYLNNSFTGGSDVCFEFDFYQVTGYRSSRFVYVSDSNSNTLYYASLQDLSLDSETWNSIKIEFRGGKIYVKNVYTDKTYSTAPSMFSFSLYGEAFTEMRFRNYKCYPI